MEGTCIVSISANVTYAKFNVTIENDSVCKDNETISPYIDKYKLPDSLCAAHPYNTSITVMDDDCTDCDVQQCK